MDERSNDFFERDPAAPSNNNYGSTTERNQNV
jgi:hypothetical protein